MRFQVINLSHGYTLLCEVFQRDSLDAQSEERCARGGKSAVLWGIV